MSNFAIKIASGFDGNAERGLASGSAMILLSAETDIHGGPVSQLSLDYDFGTQYMAANGYVVVQPNPRLDRSRPGVHPVRWAAERLDKYPTGD